MMNGLHCCILESKAIGNCSNDGISNRCKEVTLLGVKRLNGTFEPICDVFKSSSEFPPVVILERKPCGKLYYSAYPSSPDGDIMPSGWMMGGSYIKTCDSRFPFDYPIPLHDRLE